MLLHMAQEIVPAKTAQLLLSSILDEKLLVALELKVQIDSVLQTQRKHGCERVHSRYACSTQCRGSQLHLCMQTVDRVQPCFLMLSSRQFNSKFRKGCLQARKDCLCGSVMMKLMKSVTHPGMKAIYNCSQERSYRGRGAVLQLFSLSIA